MAKALYLTVANKRADSVQVSRCFTGWQGLRGKRGKMVHCGAHRYILSKRKTFLFPLEPAEYHRLTLPDRYETVFPCGNQGTIQYIARVVAYTDFDWVHLAVDDWSTARRLTISAFWRMPIAGAAQALNCQGCTRMVLASMGGLLCTFDPA